MVFRKITIIRPPAIREPDVNELLQIIGGSLGLFSMRDKDKSCFRIFILLLRGAHEHQGLTSDELADHLGLTRGTVVFHLKKLIAAGIVESHRNRYLLTVDSLSGLVAKVEADVQKTLAALRHTAEEVDRRMGF